MNIKQNIIHILKEKGCPPLYPEQLMEVLDVTKDEQRIFQSILDEMEKNGQLIVTRKKKYALPEEFGILVGRLQGHSKGFGFLIPDNPDEGDVFISPENIHGAMHNDRIMIRLFKANGDNARSREGEVLRVLERANKKIVGTFELDKYFGFVIPDDTRIRQDVFIPKDEIRGAKNGHKVVAEIVKWPESRRNPEGRIIEILGHKDDVGTDILSIIRQFNLPEEFSREVMEAARKMPEKVSEDEIARRDDLRSLKTFTIDGADAKDLDDAVSIEMLENGNYLLGVHIADVAHYIRENSSLDKEALARGNSVYLVDRVIPMLPKELSNGICSLNPGEDRLTLSVFMEIDGKGSVVKHTIKESVIRTCERLIYEDITKILDENDQELSSKYNHLSEEIENMEKLCKLLHNRRMKRGSIDFDLDESKITLDVKGKAIDVESYERGISNKIIEEFMLICNETVAEYMYWSETPFIYRVHEEPEVEKILEFNEFIHNFGHHLRGIGGEIHPKILQNLLNKIRGTREESIISTVMLRSLQKAKYNHENLGHFGLAANYYCHFTAPIRRYTDLMIHRIIKEFINKGISGSRASQLGDIVPKIALHCSERERIADEAERETEDLKMAEYMVDKIGMEFDGIISGVTGFGIYVQLENTVEGMIRLSAIEDDYYVYNEKHYCLIGERTRKIYRLGDSVRIKVINSDVATRKIDFLLVEESRKMQY